MVEEKKNRWRVVSVFPFFCEIGLDLVVGMDLVGK